jgi:hypothetical protein
MSKGVAEWWETTHPEPPYPFEIQISRLALLSSQVNLMLINNAVEQKNSNKLKCIN